MGAPLRMQAEALRILAERVRPQHLMKSGAVVRESEANHLVMMLKDAAQTLDEVERGEYDRDEDY